MIYFLRRYVYIILILLVIFLAWSSIHFYTKFNTLQTSPEKVSEEEAGELARKVGEIMIVPQDEIPTVATVSDPDALKDQSFFADAKKGDKVLIYTNAKKAILYDPVVHKIVSVAPLNIGSTSRTEKSESVQNEQQSLTPTTQPSSTKKK